MKILILNGPNLNLLGTRQPEIYGTTPFDQWFSEELCPRFPEVKLLYSQSNHEGDIIDLLQGAGQDPDCIGVVLNAGAYTHTSLAIADAISAIDTPVVEVHITNVQAREAVRHHSMISAACKGTIAGFGLDSYRLGVEALLEPLRGHDA